MGRYQCHQCYREYSRSDSLRRHKDSGVCKEAQTNMTDSDEESVSVRRSYGHGREIFWKHGPNESVEEDEEEDETEEMDEDENEEDKEDKEEEEDDDETDDNAEVEEYDDSDVDDQKIQPWDILMNITSKTRKTDSMRQLKKLWKKVQAQT